MHRSTVRLFQSIASPRRGPRLWSGPEEAASLNSNARLAGGRAVFGPALFAQSAPSSRGGAKPVKRTAAKPAIASEDDAQAPSGDQSSNVFAISNPLTTEEAWKLWNNGKGHVDYNNRVHSGELGGDGMAVIANGLREQINALTLPTHARISARSWRAFCDRSTPRRIRKTPARGSSAPPCYGRSSPTAGD